MSASVLGVCTVLFVTCLAAPAHAQYCEQDCAPNPGGGLPGGYPMCDFGCNAGGGNYTTCGAAGYACCNSYVVTAQVLGRKSVDQIAGLTCNVIDVELDQNVVACPGQTYYGGTWCTERSTGWFFHMGGSCCDLGPCWGQLYC